MREVEAITGDSPTAPEVELSAQLALARTTIEAACVLADSRLRVVTAAAERYAGQSRRLDAMLAEHRARAAASLAPLREILLATEGVGKQAFAGARRRVAGLYVALGWYRLRYPLLGVATLLAVAAGVRWQWPRIAAALDVLRGFFAENQP